MSRKEATHHRARTHGGQEGAVEASPAVKGEFGKEGQCDREVEGEDPDDGHRKQWAA